ncbi:archaeal proteasome endopeptidase complex subunit alpha [Candidatus Woesearchaeota archaeon]|nr:archaeal proteasome endopeptidase complex subunit alpha [Candidatus Woesearchaeota archaeon]
MEQMEHQMMGYDRTSAMFSPDGRLLQVEYAKKAVKQGITAVGVVCKDGVVLLADKRINERLLVPRSVDKVFQIDDHIIAASSGFMMDGRVLIERAQLIAQQHKVMNDEPMELIELVKEIADLKQFYTQYGGARPFGVSVLFAGVDDKPRLYVTDPTGIFFEYKATAIGEYENEVKSILNKDYKDNMSIDDGIKLALNALKVTMKKDFSMERIDGAYVTEKERTFVKIDKNRIMKFQK